MAATHKRVEQQRRPAVSRRKLVCAHQTEQSANTWVMLAALAATAVQKGDLFFDQVAQAVVLKSEPVEAR